MSSTPFRLRPFASDDGAGVSGLVEADSDPLWIAQGHRLHGEDRDGDRWRRTLVAELDGMIVGAATAAHNPVHPGRFVSAVEVIASAQRRAIGGALLDAVRDLRPDGRPLAGKVRPDDEAARALVRSRGGRVYQHCPGLRPDPRSAEIVDWCSRHISTDTAALSSLDVVQRADLWVQQYLWTHEDWSPAAPGPLREIAQEIVEEADPDLSVATMSGDTVAAVTWAFAESDGSFAIVSEATRRHTADGISRVAVGLARCLEQLAERDVRLVEIDGHVSDPHLAPVLGSLPPVPSNPLLLVEV